MEENQSDSAANNLSGKILDLLKEDTSAGDETLKRSVVNVQTWRDTQAMKASMEERQELESTLRDLRAYHAELTEQLRQRDDLRRELEKEQMSWNVKIEILSKKNAEMIKEKEEEIHALKEKLKALDRKGDRLKQKIQRRLKYKVFLEEAVQASGGRFPDVRELISGHNTLNSINEHLGLVTRQRKALVKKVEAELAEVVQRGSESLLCKTNELAHLQGLLDKSGAEIMNLESTLAQVHSKATKEDLELCTNKMSILNLNQTLFSTVGGEFSDSAVAPEDIYTQLDKITEYSDYLTSISKQLNKESTKKRRRQKLTK